MARKPKHPEHENLERWLVSYADFITLLFATFVVLYALSQTDISEFKKLEESLRMAFARQTLLDGHTSFFSSNSQSIIDGSSTGADPNPLMLEYLSQKYEESAMEEVKEEVERMDLDGVNVSIENKGLVVKLDEKQINFKSGSASLTDESKQILRTIGELIFSKFQIHLIRVEGHTDSIPPAGNGPFPSNWELSSARASSVIRYFINEFGVSPKLFMAVGYADTVPLKEGKGDPNKNRRVEIIVSRSKYNNINNNDLKTILNKKVKTQYVKYNSAKKDAKNIIENNDIRAPKNENPSDTAITIKNIYENENARINIEDQTQTTPSFMKH